MGVNEEFLLSPLGTDPLDESIVLDGSFGCIYAYGKLSKRETSALHLRSFHVDVGECERQHDRYCLLSKRPAAIIAIIESSWLQITDVFFIRLTLFTFVLDLKSFIGLKVCYV